MALSCTVSEIQRLIGWKSPGFPTRLIWHPRSLCTPWNFAARFGLGKLESWGYPVVQIARS